MRLILTVLVSTAIELTAGMIWNGTAVIETEKYFYQAPPSVNVSKPFGVAARPPPPPPPPPRPPPAGPASDELWAKTKNLGCTLTAAMRLSNAEAGALFKDNLPTAQSQWRNYPRDLQTWFWNPFPHERWDPQFFDFWGKWGVGHVFHDLGISDRVREEEGTIDIAAVDHESYHPDAPNVDNQYYYVDDQEYRATGASFAFGLDAEGGAIIAMNRKSPKSAAAEREPPVPDEQLPKLSQFSDIAWLAWSYIAAENVKNVRYFFTLTITNRETQQVVRRSLDNIGARLSAWPGHTFDMVSYEGRALLGTPNAMGFGYFLVQHKEQLGNMRIDKIQVFYGDTIHKMPCMVAHVSPENEADAVAPASPGLQSGRESRKVMFRMPRWG